MIWTDFGQTIIMLIGGFVLMILGKYSVYHMYSDIRLYLCDCKLLTFLQQKHGCSDFVYYTFEILMSFYY